MPYDSYTIQHASNLSPDSTPLHFVNDSSNSLTPASTSRPSDRQSRVVEPQILKHPSLFDNIRKTWTSSIDSTAVQRQTEALRSRERGEDLRSDGKFASLRGVAGDEELEEDYNDRGVDASRRAIDLASADRVLCAKWETLPTGRGGEARRILLIAYKNGAFVIWDCSNLDSWYELVSLRSLENSINDDLKTRFPRGIGSIIDFVVLSGSSIALVTRRARSSSSHVLFYSLESQEITSALDIPGTAHRIAVNRRYLVVSTSSPLALHVLSTPSLQPTPFSPITDLVPSPFDGAPVFSLGSGGRLLAYATTRAIPTSRLDRSPAKPGAGLLAHSGLFDTESSSPGQSTSEFFARSQGGGGGTLMSEAGQVGEQVARKVSEGVMSGVKAIGEVGMNYWLTKSTNGRDQGVDATARDAKLSKSAPVSSVAGFGRRLSVPTSLSRPTSSSQSPSINPTSSSVAGTVIVVDLASSAAVARTNRSNRKSAAPSPFLKIISHFRPYHLPVALLSFSPSSTSILTASTPAHSFDIFELHPSSPIGVSALRSVPSSSDANSGKVWHRYRLQRGYTSARATSVTWAADGRFVAVGTGKGTAHVYAIQPMGGQPNLENHFDPKVTNLNDLPPLSVTLSTITRIRPSPSSFDEIPQVSDSFPAFTFVSKADSFASSFRPPSSSFSSPADPARSASGKLAPLQDLLVFRPSSTTAQLYRLSATESTPSQTSSAVAAASRGDVGKLATTAVSGLTQLMKSRGGFGGMGQTLTGSSGGSLEQKKEWIPSCTAKGEWQLARDVDEEDIVEEISTKVEKVTPKRPAGSRWSAFAEIETFSRSPRVLPRSIYESQQFDFFVLPLNYIDSVSRGYYHFPQARKLEMRSQVVIRSVSPYTPSSSSTSELPFEPASFDQPIRTAMQTVLDQEAILVPGSPKLPAPSFPVGIAAKQGSWRDSIPIRSVGPAAIGGLDRVRQGLGRVRLPKAAGEIVDAARRRRSLIGSSGQAAYSSSISFDDDEAVFADRLSVEEMGSASTACTSEGEEGGLSKGLAGGEDEWAWDEPNDEPAAHPSLQPSPSPFDETLSQPLFDDADFDNFELELSTPPPSTVKPESPPASVAVDLPSSITSPSTTTTRSLAPPVSFPSNAEDPSLSSPTSPRPINPLLEVLKPTTTTSISSLPSSPSSVTSATSSSGGGGGGGGGGSKKKKRK
ncbi:hypothetical protein JCM5350_006679 [Sporobolomyces pararoseus]